MLVMERKAFVVAALTGSAIVAYSFSESVTPCFFFPPFQASFFDLTRDINTPLLDRLSWL